MSVSGLVHIYLVQRYSLITTNIAESMNSTLRHAYKLPITPLVEFIRAMMHGRFYDKRNVVERLETILTKRASVHVKKNLDVA